jgi:hypothetical protein
MTIKEIAKNNPQVDLAKLEESRTLRRALVERGVFGKRGRGMAGLQDARAKIVDDADSDSRLVRLAQ